MGYYFILESKTVSFISENKMVLVSVGNFPTIVISRILLVQNLSLFRHFFFLFVNHHFPPAFLNEKVRARVSTKFYGFIGFLSRELYPQKPRYNNWIVSWSKRTRTNAVRDGLIWRPLTVSVAFKSLFGNLVWSSSLSIFDFWIFLFCFLESGFAKFKTAFGKSAPPYIQDSSNVTFYRRY